VIVSKACKSAARIQARYAGHAAPDRFLAAAAAATNRRDPYAAAELYAEQALLQVIDPQGVQRHRGKAAIARAWEIYMGALERSGIEVSKRLVCAANELLVNEWQGRRGSTELMSGMEWWAFDCAGKVREHHLHSVRFTHVRAK
jgi:hypothetical protein